MGGQTGLNFGCQVKWGGATKTTQLFGFKICYHLKAPAGALKGHFKNDHE